MKKVITVLMAVLAFAAFVSFSGSEVDAASKAKYTMIKYDRSQTYHGEKATIKDKESYTQVVLKGNSAAVRKINSILDKHRKKKVNAMTGEYAKGDADAREGDGEYSNEYTSKVTYNQRGIISIQVSYFWFQGGVADYGSDCFTFNLKTGKQLKLTDVCKGSNASITQTIKTALIKRYTKGAFFEADLNKVSAKKCDFYLKKNNKAVVVFDKYEIAAGAAGAFDVTIRSKYK